MYPKGWDQSLLEVVAGKTGEFVVHVSSGGPRDNTLMAPQIMSRARYERLGYVFHPDYLSMYADDEFTEHAYSDGVVIEARHLLFPQSHPHHGTAEWDEVYTWENRPEAYEKGREVFERRKENGWK